MSAFQAKVLGIEKQKPLAEGLDEITVVKLEAEGMGAVSVPIESWPGGEKTAKKWEGMTVTIVGDPTSTKLKVKPLRIL